jgi:hypothetical protein
MHGSVASFLGCGFSAVHHGHTANRHMAVPGHRGKTSYQRRIAWQRPGGPSSAGAVRRDGTCLPFVLEARRRRCPTGRRELDKDGDAVAGAAQQQARDAGRGGLALVGGVGAVAGRCPGWRLGIRSSPVEFCASCHSITLRLPRKRRMLARQRPMPWSREPLARDLGRYCGLKQREDLVEQRADRGQGTGAIQQVGDRA